MEIDLDLTVYLSDDLTDEQAAEMVAHANDHETLGHDLDDVDTVPRAVGVLMMFDPEWLLRRGYVGGWSAWPIASAETPDPERHVILPDGDEYVVTKDAGNYLTVRPHLHGAPPTVIHRDHVTDVIGANYETAEVPA